MSYRARQWADHPPFRCADYKSTALRGPTQPLIPIAHTLSEITGPQIDPARINPLDSDLTKNGRVNGEPIGERIVVAGRVLDENGAPVPHTMLEIWQANAAGRYLHKVDQHPAPIDPNFFGAGRTCTDAAGFYKFYTIKPGAYPWGNHANAWRPNHIHFSLLGPAIATRLVTQMYFPGDPLLDLDPIYLGTPSRSRAALISRFDLELTEPDFALGFRFDIVLRGRDATPMER